MKFFLDENFPKNAARILEAQGHDVFDIRGTREEGADDDVMFERAQRVGAIFLTTDRDFFHTVPRRYRHHHGVIVIALRQPNGPAILRKFEADMRFMRNFKLTSNVVVFTDSRIYTTKR